MFARHRLPFAASITTGMLACTTPPPETVVASVVQVPPPMISWPLPLERPPAGPDMQAARACLLGSTGSCMELDSRPFEACLAGAKACDREGAQLMQVVPGALVQPAPR